MDHAEEKSAISPDPRGGSSATRSSGTDRAFSLLPAVLSHVLFVLLWFLCVRLGHVPAFILPSPEAAIATLAGAEYHWLSNTLVTAGEIFGGYILGVGVGIAVAIAFSWSRVAEAATMPLLVTLNMIPKVALGPLFIVWLSYGIMPNIIIAFTICFFPILLNTARGFREVQPELFDLVRSLRASRWQIFSKIQLPSALPYIMSGMKVGAVLAVAGAVVGEFLGSSRGLGYLMLQVQANLDTAAMVMAVLLITAVGVVLYVLVVGVERLTVVPDARIK
jgi:NitT/TauT family transport system permease protein